MLKVINVSKIYQKKIFALKNINLEFDKKGLIFIVGTSGSGKTTLINILGGLDKYNDGEIIFKNKSTKKFSQKDFDSYRNSYLGFIFQEYNLLNEMTVFENISIALELQGKKFKKSDISLILKKINLEGFENRQINELSGGQKQRVAIARALIKNPDIIIGDEPTGALDSETGKQILKNLKELSKEKLIIIVSHDINLANIYADRIITIKDGEIINDELKISNINNLKKNNINIENIETNNIDFHNCTYVENYRPIYSKLPSRRSFQIALNALKHNISSLIFNVLLMVVSFVFLGLALSFAFYDRNKTIKNSFLQSKDIPLLIELTDNKNLEQINKFKEQYLNSNFELVYHLDPIYYSYYLKEKQIPKNLFSYGLDANFIFNSTKYDDSYFEKLNLKIIKQPHSDFENCFISEYLKNKILKNETKFDKKETNFIDKVGILKVLNKSNTLINIEILNEKINDNLSQDNKINFIEQILKTMKSGIYKHYKENSLENVFFMPKNFLYDEKLSTNFLIGNVEKLSQQQREQILKKYNNKEISLQKVTFVMFIEGMDQILKKISLVFIFIGINYAIFSMILLFNFIASSIKYKKKDIGILRAIGSSGFDIFSIFTKEVFFIGLIVFTISYFLIQIIMFFLNKFVSNFLSIHFFSFEPKQVIIIAIIIFSICFVTSFLQILKISIKKPIDIILNR